MRIDRQGILVWCFIVVSSLLIIFAAFAIASYEEHYKERVGWAAHCQDQHYIEEN